MPHLKMLGSTLLVWSGASLSSEAQTSIQPDCASTLNQLKLKTEIVAKSMNDTGCHQSAPSQKVHSDWPDQTLYMLDLLKQLDSSIACLPSDNGKVVQSSINFLNCTAGNVQNSPPNGGGWYRSLKLQLRDFGPNQNKSVITMGKKAFAAEMLFQKIWPRVQTTALKLDHLGPAVSSVSRFRSLTNSYAPDLNRASCSWFRALPSQTDKCLAINVFEAERKAAAQSSLKIPACFGKVAMHCQSANGKGQ